MGFGETHLLTSLFFKATVLCGCGTALMLNMYDCSIPKHLQLTSLNLQDRLQRGYLVKILCHLGLKSEFFISLKHHLIPVAAACCSVFPRKRGSVTFLRLSPLCWCWRGVGGSGLGSVALCSRSVSVTSVPVVTLLCLPHTIRTSHMWTNNHCPHVNCKKRLHGQIPARFWSQRRRELRDIGQKRDMVEASLHWDGVQAVLTEGQNAMMTGCMTEG